MPNYFIKCGECNEVLAIKGNPNEAKVGTYWKCDKCTKPVYARNVTGFSCHTPKCEGFAVNLSPGYSNKCGKCKKTIYAVNQYQIPCGNGTCSEIISRSSLPNPGYTATCNSCNDSQFDGTAAWKTIAVKKFNIKKL